MVSGSSSLGIDFKIIVVPCVTASRRTVCSKASSASSGSSREVPLSRDAEPPISTAASMLINPKTKRVSRRVKPRRRLAETVFTNFQCRPVCLQFYHAPWKINHRIRYYVFQGNGIDSLGPKDRQEFFRFWLPYRDRANDRLFLRVH